MCVGMDASKYNPIAKIGGKNTKFLDPGSAIVQKLEKRTQDNAQAKANAMAPSYAAGPTVGTTALTPAPVAKGGSTYLGSSS
jgi:hypothetical protein